MNCGGKVCVFPSYCFFVDFIQVYLMHPKVDMYSSMMQKLSSNKMWAQPLVFSPLCFHIDLLILQD